MENPPTVERNGIFYVIAPDGTTDVPFTGTFTDKYYNGVLRTKTTYKDGKKHGPWECYYENGQLKDKVSCKDGKLDGPYECYYENGQLMEKGTYKNGKPDGPWESCDKKGRLELKGTFKDGKSITPVELFLCPNCSRNVHEMHASSGCFRIMIITGGCLLCLTVVGAIIGIPLIWSGFSKTFWKNQLWKCSSCGQKMNTYEVRNYVEAVQTITSCDFSLDTNAAKNNVGINKELTSCTTCGKSISTEAKSCPNCGKPYPTFSDKIDEVATGAIKGGIIGGFFGYLFDLFNNSDDT